MSLSFGYGQVDAAPVGLVYDPAQPAELDQPVGQGSSRGRQDGKLVGQLTGQLKLDTSFDNFARINDLLKSPEVARDLGAEGQNDDDKDKDIKAKDDKDSE